jgi:hypothetical protein
MGIIQRVRVIGILGCSMLSVLPPAIAQNVDDGHGREWQQFKNYAGVSWNSLAARCPHDGATPCSLADGRPGDWIWATADQVKQLMSYWAPELATQPSSENAFAANGFLSSFQPTFSFCGTYQCGTSGAGLTSSRDIHGVPIVGSAGWGTNLVSFTGGLGVGPSGDAAAGSNGVGAFFFRYTGPGIFAYDDAGTLPSPDGGTAVANVLANDWIAGVRATVANVSLSQESASVEGITLDTADGSVDVALGTYALVYRICEIANPGNCDNATATVTVRPNRIDAVNDYGRGSSKTANTPIASVLANDTLNGLRAATPAVVLTQVSLTPATSGITLNLTTGAVTVKTKTSSGLYYLTHSICEAASPTNCDTAVATIELSGKSN